MGRNETIIKAKAMEALLKKLDSSVYDTDDEVLNDYSAGATLELKHMFDEIQQLNWFENSEK